MILTYEHHGKMVAVEESNKGKHRENCLCWKCSKFTPDNRETNCPIANKLYAICCEHNVTTPVWECPDFGELV